MIKARMTLWFSLAVAFGGLLAAPLSAQDPGAPGARAAANITIRSYPARDPSPDPCVLIDIHMQLPHGLWSAPGADVQGSGDDEPHCMSAREQRLRLRSDRSYLPDRRS